MPEIDAASVYESVITELQRQLPDLYSEVLAEIDKGREMKASEISRIEKTSRDRELKSQRLTKLTDNDLAVVALTPEERLMVVVRAISVATESHNASVAMLARFADEHGAEGIDFVSPDGEPPDEAAISAGVAAAEGRRSLDLHSDEATTVNRESIDAVLAVLEADVEHD